MLHLVILPLLLTNQQPDTGTLAAVRAALVQTPIEAFKDDTGHVSVNGATTLAVPGRTAPVTFAWITPSFRATPTILAFLPDSHGTLTRMTEGLAPGRLEPVSGHLADTHTMGLAADLTVGTGEKVDTLQFVRSEIRNGMSLTRYHSFFHAEMREGPPSYVDVYSRVLGEDSTTCQDVEFSRVDAVSAGRLSAANADTYLVALTAHNLTIYRIDSVTSDGMLAKSTWMQPRPDSASSLVVGPDGLVHLTTTDGRTVSIPPPQ